MLKKNLDHLLANTIISEKPTLSYADLQALLSQAANIVNDRPIGVKSLTEDELVPLTVNQLLLGRTATIEPVQIEVDPEGYVAADQYLTELMGTWWKLWKQRTLPHLLPYYKWQEAQRHRNLQPGDICMMLYESKVLGSYRLCRIITADPSEDECIRTVTVGYLPRKNRRQATYHPVPLEMKEVAIQRLVLLVPMEEQQHNKQAAEQDDAYTNHYQELCPDEQPRARTTTPTWSLPPTTRPAGAGGQCRAGPTHRLVAMSSVLCLTPPFLCANPKLTEDDEKELPKNVVDPLLYTSSPLSILGPKTLSLYEDKPSALSLCEVKPSALSLCEVKPKDLPLREIKPNTLSQNESKPKNVSQNEIKPNTLSQNESKPKNVSQNEIKTKDLLLCEIKPKDLSQYEMVSPSSPLSAYLSLLANGTGGAWTGHSTDAHRSLPPALQPGIWELIKTGCLSGWSTSVKKTLSGVPRGAVRDEGYGRDFQTRSDQDLQASPPGVSGKLQ